MKKLLILVMVMLILFVGCAAEEPVVPEPEQSIHGEQPQTDTPELLEHHLYDDVSKTATYQLWEVEKQILEGDSGVVFSNPPTVDVK